MSIGLGPRGFRELRPIWRILVSLIILQQLGGLIGLLIGVHYSAFMNYWVGGAIATLPGFLLGLAWQLKATQERRSWLPTACLVGLLAAMLTGQAALSDLPGLQDEMRRLEDIAQMRAESIRRIDVFDRYGREKIVSVTDPESIHAFVEGIADAVGHSPNHPGYTHTWYVVVDGAAHREFELHLTPKLPESVAGDIVVKLGDLTSYFGTFQSKGLRPWVEEHLHAASTR
ncbi:MAG: hypothetical protein JXR94_02290 [Candidatus Hydrogenedentes bacterium]|nr:hypothetical protein [Candidatus Hydrogenedentota bacterium]